MCNYIQNIWPDWNIVRLIGEGSFGKVYEIVRNNFGIEEHCALKVISIPSSKAELQSAKNDGMDRDGATEYFKGLVEEFVREIAVMSKLKGNVNAVGYEDYAVVKHQDSFGWDILIRMELLTDLPSFIRHNGLTQRDVLKLAVDLCSALEVCHKQKIIHRDIKPDNIFIDQFGNFKLGDFGVARTIEKASSGLSKKGTYTYMAPEVYKSEKYGFDVDLYSLGIVMYRLLNNNREPFLPRYPQPIKFNDKSEALVRRMTGETILPIPGVNYELNEIILKACSYNSSERYGRAEQMKADLSSIDVLLLDDGTGEVKSGFAEEQPSAKDTDELLNAIAEFGIAKETVSVANGKNSEYGDTPRFICPNCGVAADANDEFCLKCGQKFIKPEELQKRADVHGGCGSEDDRIVCPKCGAINDFGDRYCLKCGNNLESINTIQKKIPCPSCGSLAALESNFCFKCGRKLK